MNDRIKLAEAMGWSSVGDPDGNVYWSAPPAKYPESYCFDTDELPDPFTDANDDYAVLEWMRGDSRRMEFPRYVGALSDVMDKRLAASHAANYKIGDYARAALEVIDK